MHSLCFCKEQSRCETAVSGTTSRAYHRPKAAFKQAMLVRAARTPVFKAPLHAVHDSSEVVRHRQRFAAFAPALPHRCESSQDGVSLLKLADAVSLPKPQGVTLPKPRWPHDVPKGLGPLPTLVPWTMVQRWFADRSAGHRRLTRCPRWRRRWVRCGRVGGRNRGRRCCAAQTHALIRGWQRQNKIEERARASAARAWYGC